MRKESERRRRVEEEEEEGKRDDEIARKQCRRPSCLLERKDISSAAERELLTHSLTASHSQSPSSFRSPAREAETEKRDSISLLRD